MPAGVLRAARTHAQRVPRHNSAPETRADAVQQLGAERVDRAQRGAPASAAAAAAPLKQQTHVVRQPLPPT